MIYRCYDYQDTDTNEEMATFGYVRKSDIPDLEFMKDMLEGVIENLYETGDIVNVQRCLEELCWQLNVKFPTTKPMIGGNNE